MRVASLGVARPAYYDRNATNTWNAFASGGIAPHGATTRWTITVASGKKAVIEAANAIIWRETVATTLAQSLAILRLTSGGTTGDVGIAAFNTNTLLSPITYTLPYGMTLYAADVLTGVTYDGATGGTNYYNIVAKGTIFDA